MRRNLAVKLIDTNKVYAVQPDAIICELETLTEWLELLAQLALHDPARNEAISHRAERDGVNSIHFGHVSKTVVTQNVDSKLWDIAVQGVANRERTLLEILAASRFGNSSARVYAAEAMSALARELRAKYSRFLGSQYAPDEATRLRMFPIPHQDLLGLSMPDACFDVVTTCEVLEHVPNLSRALSELARILVPGGMMLSTFPFLWDTECTLMKAELIDGKIRHLVEKPEIHGDPMSKDGALVFQIPGWDIVRMAKGAGFKNAKFVFYSSAIGGIIGGHLIGRFVFVCER
jgi:SAM-dependent methyltransferase